MHQRSPGCLNPNLVGKLLDNCHGNPIHPCAVVHPIVAPLNEIVILPDASIHRVWLIGLEGGGDIRERAGDGRIGRGLKHQR